MQREFLPEVAAGLIRMDVNTLKTVGTEWLAAYPNLPLTGGQWVVLICAETSTLRWTDDSTDPTATRGVPMAVGEKFMYTGANPAAIRILGAGAFATIAVWRMR